MIPKHIAVYLLAFFLIPFLVDAKKYRYEESEQYLRKYEHIPKYSHNREGKKHYIKHKHNHEKFNEEVNPPDHTKYIAMARFVVHQADWTSVATLSTIPSLRGFPFTSVASMADGTVDNPTGIPYFYLTPLDLTAKDLQKDNRCTVSVTLEETDYCRQQNMDPQDPRCARVMLSGQMKRVNNNTAEYDFAHEALFSRHPSMATLPADHKFFIAKLKISQIAMLDWYGGPKFLSVKDYLAYKPDKNTQSVSLIETNEIMDNIAVYNV